MKLIEKELTIHEKYFKYKCLSKVHKDYIRSIKFNRTNYSIISASSDNCNPLKISYMDKSYREYNFNLDKVKIFLYFF